MVLMTMAIMTMKLAFVVVKVIFDVAMLEVEVIRRDNCYCGCCVGGVGTASCIRDDGV